MAKKCIFCGEEIPAFGGKKLTYGGYTEIVCDDCFEKYHDLNGVDLARKILSSGRAKNHVGIRDYMNDQIKYEQQRIEREQQQEEEFKINHPVMGKCPKCDGEMHQYGPISFKLGDETFFFSDLNRLMTGSMTVTLIRCRKCGYTEFYTPNENELL